MPVKAPMTGEEGSDMVVLWVYDIMIGVRGNGGKQCVPSRMCLFSFFISNAFRVITYVGS